MPSSYTAGVADGTIVDFREYALKCARAFGALILMRDDPLDAEIPDQFEPSDFYLKRLDESRTELVEIEEASDLEIQGMIEKEYTEKISYNQKSLKRIRQERQRYEAMLEKAQTYKPPTDEHEEFAKFLVSQLEESIKFDCGESYYVDPTLLDAVAWKTQRMEQLREQIVRYQKEYAEEIERTNQRNQWVSDLRKSLQ